jgi:hypothetical protein
MKLEDSFYWTSNVNFNCEGKKEREREKERGRERKEREYCRQKWNGTIKTSTRQGRVDV